MSNDNASPRDPARDDASDDDSPSAVTSEAHNRRREQVRRAQRSHRERRANYLRTLEAEVQDLRAKDAKNTVEIEHFKTINRRLCSILKEHRIPIPHDLDRASHEKLDFDFQDVGVTEIYRSPKIPILPSAPAPPETTTSPDSLLDLDDPQIAVDFVMELEAPCLVSHPHFHGPDGEQGHIMQLRNMVVPHPLADAGLPTFTPQQPAISARNFSNTELRTTLQRLLEASSSLNMPGELTPVQCWNSLRADPTTSKISKSKFDELKRALLSRVICYGFGAVIDAGFFRDLTARLP